MSCFGPTGSPLLFQNLADAATFRPILQSEIPPEWHNVDARQLAEARRAFGLPEDQPVRAVTCIELPDMQPFWAYERWASQQGQQNQVRFVVVSMDSFRGGGQAAMAGARESLRLLLHTGRPALHWSRAFVPGDDSSDAGPEGR